MGGMRVKQFEPEGSRRTRLTRSVLRRAMERGEVLEGLVTRCDADHTLCLSLGEAEGLIPREEAAVGVAEGTVREAAVLSCVGRQVCFRVQSLTETESGLTAFCSRRRPQQEALDAYRSGLRPGDVLRAVVTGLADFGAFCDIGRGVTALLPTADIAVARSRSAAERFVPGQRILAVVRSVDGGRFRLSHRELLGTWEDNAARFEPGQTVPGIVRGVMPFGVFVELTPNLTGLCEPREDLQPGQRVSVYIRSIQPEKQKVKLSVVGRLPPDAEPPVYQYVRRAGHLDFWRYAPALNGREPILTCF